MEPGLGFFFKAHFAEGEGDGQLMCQAEERVDFNSCFLCTWPHLLPHPPKTIQYEWKVCLSDKTQPPLP